MTIYEVMQKAVDALGAVDVTKLSLADVGMYVHTLSELNGIKEPDPTFSESMKEITEKMVTGCAFPKAPSIGELS